ncbi:biogenesis of lysosome-related organelles complex 1 subunit 5 [Mixophyes fleayi]|uniref:biogenesis of lysosome-related organelles complex 1 subunit 5 n=1 Tax=Mixophyes fleayi TaxID=3061075 RepID=UPI003F4E2012
MNSYSPAKPAGTPPVLSPKHRDNVNSMGPATQLIIKDVGEIHSRLLDHRPIIQGETRYFIKEFEEKRGHREIRVLENVKNSVSETNDPILPRCADVMQNKLGLVLETLETANQIIHRLHQQEQENAKGGEVNARNEKLRSQWGAFMKEQEERRLAVDEEHSKAVLRLKEQHALMNRVLSKTVSF